MLKVSMYFFKSYILFVICNNSLLINRYYLYICKFRKLCLWNFLISCTYCITTCRSLNTQPNIKILPFLLND